MRGQQCPKAHRTYLEAKSKQAQIKKQEAAKQASLNLAEAENLFDETAATSEGENYFCSTLLPRANSESILPSSPSHSLHIMTQPAFIDHNSAPQHCFSAVAQNPAETSTGIIDSAATIPCGDPATSHVIRTGACTGSTKMKLAKGPPQEVPTYPLAFPTVTQDQKPFLLATPGTSGISIANIQPLVSIPTLLEHGFECHLALPTKEHINSCNLCRHAQFRTEIDSPTWGGYLRAPEKQGGHTIILQYTRERLWRLPTQVNDRRLLNRTKPIETQNPYHALTMNAAESAGPELAPFQCKASNPVDHDRQQRKLLQLQEIQAQAVELHQSMGHFAPETTLRTAKFHNIKVSKPVATALRKLKCADCLLGHGNRKQIKTKRTLDTNTTGLSVDGDIWDADDLSFDHLPWSTPPGQTTDIKCAPLPQCDATLISAVMFAMPSLPAQHHDSQCTNEEGHQAKLRVKKPPKRRVRWDDDVKRMAIILSFTGASTGFRV